MRSLKRIYADWQSGYLASDAELEYMLKRILDAANTSRDVGAGAASSLYFVMQAQSMEMALNARRRRT